MKRNYIYESEYNGVRYWKVNHDINGNPRYVIHFPDMLSDAEFDRMEIMDAYKLALERARPLNGRTYRAKWFGGGILFYSFDIKQTINEILKLRGE